MCIILDAVTVRVGVICCLHIFLIRIPIEIIKGRASKLTSIKYYITRVPLMFLDQIQTPV